MFARIQHTKFDSESKTIALEVTKKPISSSKLEKFRLDLASTTLNFPLFKSKDKDFGLEGNRQLKAAYPDDAPEEQKTPRTSTLPPNANGICTVPATSCV